jgi:hypothetical protein
MGTVENMEGREERSTDVERDGKQGKEVESDYEPARDSVSSQGEANSNEDTRAKRVSRVPKKLVKKDSKENSPRSGRINSNRQVQTKLQYISSNNLQSKSPKPNKTSDGAKTIEITKPDTVTVPSCPSSEVSEEMDDKPIENIVTDDKSIEDVADDKATEGTASYDKATEGKAADDTTVEDNTTDERSIESGTDDRTIAGIAADVKSSEEAKEIDILDEAPNCDQSTATDEEIADTEESIAYDGKSAAYEKSEELESKCERLEQELREVAALEISLYSVVPEHGCSSHKLHTPARRLSRLYVHASKFWSSDKKASVTKNFVSGLVLVAKSCGNDVSR